MSQTSSNSALVTCPFCGYPYPMSDMQREVFIGRNMGCMNCGRPFKVEAPAPPVEETAPVESAGADAADNAATSAPSTPGSSPAAAPKPAPLRPNPPAVIGFISALLFFVLVAAATVISAAAPDSDNDHGRTGTMPHTPAGILTALAIVSASLAILFSSAGLVRTRRVATAHGAKRTAGRGMAIAGLSIGGAGLLITVIVLSTVVPVMDRQREMARREACKANMAQIASALAAYANSNHGHYPDSLAPLVASGALSRDALVCPSSSDTPASGATPAQQAAALAQPGHESYIYVAKGLTATSPATAVLLYEPATNHIDVANVLFRDGLIVPVPASLADTLRGELDTGKNPGPTAVSLHP